MVDLDNGGLVPIDFGHAFHTATQVNNIVLYIVTKLAYLFNVRYLMYMYQMQPVLEIIMLMHNR